jgi:hypothetical protein
MNKWGKLYCIKQSLKYLSADTIDLINILLVCKEWNKKFKKEVYKNYLIE